MYTVREEYEGMEYELWLYASCDATGIHPGRREGPLLFAYFRSPVSCLIDYL